MAIHTRLQKRKESGVYYCRVCVPKKLRHIIGKSEIHVSLKTSSVMVARERVRLESLKIDRMLAEADGRISQINGLGAFLAPMSYVAPISPPSISFLGLVERFMVLPEKAKLTDKGKLEYRVTFRLLAELFGGDTPINAITRVAERTKAFIERSNLLKEFFDDTFEVAEGGKVTASSAYRYYGNWCKDNGYRPMSEHQFKDAFERTTGIAQERGNQNRYWPNMRLKGGQPKI